ncbi:MAG: HD domain-containing protein [Prevotellaceae bacterium]|jgi:HD superfamily phosphohydrolase|nr:HD domain-containing protein [Prevotellaceae bacterium]
MYEQKIINDPVFGFIVVPKGLLYEVVQHPLMQRLTRIKQVGLSSVVYPGAQHTRFQHSLGAFFLMTEALKQLRSKGHFLFEAEAEAAQAAILLHDVGHGPFSHVLEDTLVPGIRHETISKLMMEQMNTQLEGRLTLAIQIFCNRYPKHYLHQLVSGQLDMDRMDYLRRDAYYTGVSEATIGSARIIRMLNVQDDQLVVEAKGLYSIENFLTARRLMYAQVYLHKTSVAYECMLVSALRRAKALAAGGVQLFASPALRFFLYEEITPARFVGDDDTCLQQFARLDDNDIWTALKVWSEGDDTILSTLAHGLVNRRIFKVQSFEAPVGDEVIDAHLVRIARTLGITREEARHFIATPVIETHLYDPADEGISIQYPDGTVRSIAEASEMLNLAVLEQKGQKYYLCYFAGEDFNLSHRVG